MEISGGNISLADAKHLQAAARTSLPDWTPGDTEPWVIDAITGLLMATGQRNVLELGGYHGATSAALAETLTRLGGGHLIVVEYDEELCPLIAERLSPYPESQWQIWGEDVLDALPRLKDESIGFAFVDDNHDALHVAEEVDLLIPKMIDGGVICFHDVCGAYAIHHLVTYYGGIALNLPRVSHSGGLGILQVTPSVREKPKMTFRFDEDHPAVVLHAGQLVFRVMGEVQQPV